MTNGGKDVKIGHDKRPISVIPDNKQPLYSKATGQKLLDEYGNELIVETDTYNLKDQGSDRSTSIVFPSTEDTYKRVKYETILNDYEISWSAGTNLVTFAVPADAAGIVTTGDKLSGVGIPDGTIFTGGRSGSGGYRISNNLEGNVGSRTIDVLRRSKEVKKSDPIWKIQEQFAQSSEVSNTLLGVNRAELQLSLFSDVSSYGLDVDEFEFSNFNTGTSLHIWNTRTNKLYGNRYNGKVIEETSESAVKLGGFRVPYSFPYPPSTADLGLYNPSLYAQYINFINLGLDLYEYYNGPNGASYPQSWKTLFLNPAVVEVTSNTVKYIGDSDDSFAAVDDWTETWRDILKQNLKDPVSNTEFTFSTIQDLSSTFKSRYPVATDLRPGYSDTNSSYSKLESRRVFRYQPGRISGFTFGVRASTESVAGYNIEWGIGNPTDQYLFKIKQGNLYIVRRSTIPLNASALERSGLSLTDQDYIASGDGNDKDPITGDLKKYYTIEVPQDNFNGDALDGNGPSGYGIQAKNVTMWKIEFGWYGAIGCRFYAYIPVKNGDARWVVAHTFVIENSLNQPCLQDSYFKLKYVLHTFNTADLREPQYVYKYGSSYYIDGGDEGTKMISSSSSGNKQINTTHEETLLGITCKDIMVNSVGQEIKNKKTIFPISATFTSDSLSEIRVQRCKACPGFGHVHTPGVQTGVNGRLINVAFLDANTFVGIGTTTGTSISFSPDDDGAKMVAPTLWNAYVTNLSQPDGSGGFEQARVSGYVGVVGRQLGIRDIADNSLYRDPITGSDVTIPSDVNGTQVYAHQVRLSNWNNAVVSSTQELTGSEITIQFLNPQNKDVYNHYADFAIGVTNIEPDIDPATPTVLDGWNIAGVSTTILPNANMLYDYHSHRYANQDLNGVETGEAHGAQFPNPNMEIDYRIPTVSSPAGGTCSNVVISVNDPESITGLEQITTNPVTGATGFFLSKVGSFPASILFTSGEVVVENNGVLITTLTYTSEPVSYLDGTTSRSFISISGDITPFTPGNVSSGIELKIRPVRLKSSSRNVTKLYNYNPYPLYFVAKLGDKAAINNISIKEKIGDYTRTIAPIYALSTNAQLTNASNLAETDGSPPTNFIEIDRLSSAIVDNQNTQRLRNSELKDVFYIGENETKKVDMSKVFGPDKTLITPTNNNIEATFFTAKKIKGSGNGNVQMSINYGEQ